MNTHKFDINKLTIEDKLLLEQFTSRRKQFDKFICENGYGFYTCPGCGFPTLEERGCYQICPICEWEDNNQDDENANEVWGGPNYDLSLTEKRLKINIILNNLSDKLNGKINENGEDVLAILRNHQKRMKIIIKKISPNTEIYDPIWVAYREESKRVLNDLISQ